MERENNWQKGYLRASSNLKLVINKYLKRLTMAPLEVKNGGVKLTSKDLKKGLDDLIKKHLEKKKYQWQKENLIKQQHKKII